MATECETMRQCKAITIAHYGTCDAEVLVSGSAVTVFRALSVRRELTTGQGAKPRSSICLRNNLFVCCLWRSYFLRKATADEGLLQAQISLWGVRKGPPKMQRGFHLVATWVPPGNRSRMQRRFHFLTAMLDIEISDPGRLAVPVRKARRTVCVGGVRVPSATIQCRGT